MLFLRLSHSIPSICSFRIIFFVFLLNFILQPTLVSAALNFKLSFNTNTFHLYKCNSASDAPTLWSSQKIPIAQNSSFLSINVAFQIVYRRAHLHLPRSYSQTIPTPSPKPCGHHKRPPFSNINFHYHLHFLTLIITYTCANGTGSLESPLFPTNPNDCLQTKLRHNPEFFFPYCSSVSLFIIVDLDLLLPT